MAGKTLVIEDLLRPDLTGTWIAEQYVDWENRRQVKMAEWQEIISYVYATDTTKTTNSKLPWSNKTTIPKLCQIVDNLYANYMASLFPKRKWMSWEGDTEEDEVKEKKKAIEAYITYCINRNDFITEMGKIVYDYVIYGNAFGTIEWVDRRNQTPDKMQVGYVGPVVRRISPTDFVFNPIAPSFAESPKIVRSLVSIGEVKEMLTRMTSENEDTKEEAQDLLNYITELRSHLAEIPNGGTEIKNEIYNISGFGSYYDYLRSDYVEILTFYGDLYDKGTGEFKRNQIIKVIDRHKVLSQKDNPSFFGTAPIWNVGWRQKADNLWAMGPLDNLIGMQYRIDHLENMKADIWDLTRYPIFKVKGYVDDFEWRPGEHILVGDDGDVDMISPDTQVLNFNTEISILEAKMEEMAGSPKEAMGFRTPGEKTKYEVQRLENAAARIFQSKTIQFEREMVEPLLNGMLELAKRNLDKASIRLWDNEEKYANFLTLTSDDITGNGRLVPVAARHFAEQAELVQNLTNFYSSAVGQDPDVRAHISSIGIARTFEQVLSLEDYKIIEPYIRLTEQAQAQQLANVQQENTTAAIGTPSGVIPGDF